MLSRYVSAPRTEHAELAGLAALAGRAGWAALAALAAAVALALTVAVCPAPAFADSASTILTLGNDLTDDQRETVLEFFGLTDDDLDDLQVITVTNDDEREYLEGTVSDSIIGTKTLSCSYIQLTSSGGINVETANLTYVTKNTIYNALQTAGIENCDVVVTAPYDVSGTGALTGIFLAVESTGAVLDEDKKEAATEELVATAELEETYGSEVAEVISDVKDEVTSSDEDLSTEEVAELVEDTASDYGISLSDDDLATITDLIETIQNLDYDVNAFSDTLSGLTEGGSGILAGIQSFFQSIFDFFKNLIAGFTGGSDDADDEDDGSSIIDNLNTDVYELDDADDEGAGSSSTTSDSTASDGTAASDDATAADESDAGDDAASSEDGNADADADSSASGEDDGASAASDDEAADAEQTE